MLADKAIVIDDVRVRGIGHSYDSLPETLVADFARRRAQVGTQGFPLAPVLAQADKVVQRPIYFEGQGRVSTPIIRLAQVSEGERVPGPAVLVDETQTLLIEPACTAYRLARGVLVDIHYD